MVKAYCYGSNMQLCQELPAGDRHFILGPVDCQPDGCMLVIVERDREKPMAYK